MNNLVDVSRLFKTYRQGTVATAVLREVSLEVPARSFTAVVGPSGCGKTTLLGILGGLDRGEGGHVFVDGLDLLAASPRQLVAYRRHTVGIVFQFYNLLPTLTAAENVEAGLEFLPLSSRARRARARDWLERVGLAELADRFPAQLSGGQQQRVAVARVLAREPKLLLADEPTGNLDAEAGEQIFAAMRALTRESGTTCIMVTHDASLAERADERVRMRDGKIEPAPCFDRSGEISYVRSGRASGTPHAYGWR
jgi:putative ABC transport system ATP-binding protein